MPGAFTPEGFARVLASRRSAQEFFLRHGAVCLGLSSGAAQDLALNAADAAGASQAVAVVGPVTANPAYANGRIPAAVGNR
jgi:hypothetical protein